jgi:hypothetical protein
LLRVEDQEDVDAMQGANKEIRDNDDEDVHEFDEIQGLEGEGPEGAPHIQTEGLTDEQLAELKK